MLNKAQRTDAYAIWNRFVHGGKTADLPPHIRQSWQRCRHAKVDPRKEPKLIGLDQKALRKRIDEQLDLSHLLQSHNKNLETYFDLSPLAILFTGTDGTVLSAHGHERILRRIEDNLQTQILGGSLKEAVVGTTAPGICLEEQRFASVHAEEHYVRNFHWSSCIATPLFDFEQNLLGCLDFTVAYRDVEKLKHLIPVLLNTANCIQFELSLKNKLEQFDLFHSYYRSTFDYSNSMLLLVDGNGHIIDINRAAREYFRVNPLRVRNAGLGAIFDDCGKLLSILNSCGGRHFVHSRQGDRFAAESIPLSDSGESDITFLLRIEREKPLKRIAAVSNHSARYTFSSIIGDHPALVQVVEKARKAALTGSTILIEGETGTGKELFAHAIHTASPYQHGPFVAVNCSAFPRELIESELFGYEKGAYTGARTDGSPGKFELADSGTIFLDEIHTMDKATQMKILRVIEDRRVTRIGGKRPIPLDIRIVAASSENMDAEMAAGNFLAPLYYRLNVVKLAVPSLRQHKTDIPVLVDHFIGKMNTRFNRSIKKVSPEAMKMMSSHRWPGNVRELKNCLESAFNFSTGDTIMGSDLFDGMPNHDPCEPTPGETLDDLTRKSMIDALQQFGNVKQAARSLDIPLATFYRKLKKYGIAWGKGRGLRP